MATRLSLVLISLGTPIFIGPHHRTSFRTVETAAAGRGATSCNACGHAITACCLSPALPAGYVEDGNVALRQHCYADPLPDVCHDDRTRRLTHHRSGRGPGPPGDAVRVSRPRGS